MIVEIDGKHAAWTLKKTVAAWIMLPWYPYLPFPVAGKHLVALIVDGDNPGSDEHYILVITSIQDETR